MFQEDLSWGGTFELWPHKKKPLIYEIEADGSWQKESNASAEDLRSDKFGVL